MDVPRKAKTQDHVTLEILAFPTSGSQACPHEPWGNIFSAICDVYEMACVCVRTHTLWDHRLHIGTTCSTWPPKLRVRILTVRNWRCKKGNPWTQPQTFSVGLYNDLIYLDKHCIWGAFIYYPYPSISSLKIFHKSSILMPYISTRPKLALV